MREEKCVALRVDHKISSSRKYESSYILTKLREISFCENDRIYNRFPENRPISTFDPENPLHESLSGLAKIS
jgi:hypothetical protein